MGIEDDPDVSSQESIKHEAGAAYGKVVKPEPKVDMSSQAVYERIGPDEAVSEMHEGGHSINPRTGERPDRGVFVSIEGHEREHELATYGKKQLADWLNSDSLLSELTMTSRYVGGWSEKGQATLDLTRGFPENFQGRKSARQFAKRNNQQALFQRSDYTNEYNPYHPKNIAPGHTLAPGEGEKWKQSEERLGTREPIVERDTDQQRAWMFGGV